MGDFPMMTEHGTFIINGTERVIVTQLVRTPGAYLMEPKDATKQVFTANLMPSRGSWLELEIDKKGVVYARIDRKRKLPITTLLRALPAEDPTTGYAIDTSSNEKILELFGNSLYIASTLDKDPSDSRGGGPDRGVQEAAPRRAADARQRAQLLNALFFDPKRYDLTKVGRYKLNQRLGVDVPDDLRVLTTQDIVALSSELVGCPQTSACPRTSKDFAADAVLDRGADRRARRVRALRQPPPAHRRRADPGGVPHRALPHGARRPRAHDDRGRRHDHAADDHQHPAGGGGAEGVLRLLAALPVHGPDQLAGRTDAPPPPLGARRRAA